MSATSAASELDDPPPRRSPTEPHPIAPWPPLPPGTALTVVKRAPDGHEVTRYPGTLLAGPLPEPWVAVEARWVSRPVELNGLWFRPGDRLVEYFSPDHPYNAFAVVAPDGALRGWYANVTYPAILDATVSPAILTWHDLYVDVVVLPDGTVHVRDEDELAEAALAERDPRLHAMIVSARDRLLDLVRRAAFPFGVWGATDRGRNPASAIAETLHGERTDRPPATT